MDMYVGCASSLIGSWMCKCVYVCVRVFVQDRVRALVGLNQTRSGGGATFKSVKLCASVCVRVCVVSVTRDKQAAVRVPLT